MIILANLNKVKTDHNPIMLLNLTEEQIIQLAPDASSVKAGKGLATQSKWVLLEYSGRAIWGHCQGSGKTPYQTVVDTKNIAFKCSCPSRKFPCKHGLGLLFLYASHAALFKEAEEPDWVAAWLSKREEKAEKKEQKIKSDAPVDEAAQAKRQAMRHDKVLNGIEDLQIWMKDLMRNGLIHIPERAYSLFDGMARRMIDSQAPGLANRLKAIQEIDFYAESWKYELTDRLGKLYLLTESYKNLDTQPEDWQWEIRTQTGYPQAKEEVLSGEAVADQWLVLHKRSRKINELNTDTHWLYGRRSKRFAVYLSFTTPGTLSERNLVPGSVYDGKLCFYKGVCASRALFKECGLSGEKFLPSFCTDLREAASRYRKAAQENPFIEDMPVLVENIRLAGQGKQLYLQDANHELIPVRMQDSTKTAVLSVTGGKPFAAFLLANATCWELNTIWYQSDYYIWRDERN
nr:SWIM zinc finger family protein [Bacteroides salyersiae]